MEEQTAAGDSLQKRIGIAQIPPNSFYIEFGDTTAGTNEGAYTMAALRQQAGDVPSHESGSACDKSGLQTISMSPRQADYPLPVRFRNLQKRGQCHQRKV